MSDAPLMVMYAVRSRDGMWLRRKGYGGYGESWVDDIRKARIYPKPGPARAQVTFWATQHPSYGIPELVELHITVVKAVAEDDRVQKSQQRKEEREARHAERRAKEDLERAKRKKREAEEAIDRLRKAAEQADKNRLLRLSSKRKSSRD